MSHGVRAGFFSHGNSINNNNEIYIYIYIYIERERERVQGTQFPPCLHNRTIDVRSITDIEQYLFMHTEIYIYIYIYIYMYVYVCMYTCVCVCVCVNNYYRYFSTM